MLSGLRRLFSGKKTITSITMDELMRSRAGLDKEEQTILSDVQKLEKEKERLLLKGADDPSPANRAVAARRFKAKDLEVKHSQANLRLISSQHQMVSGLVQVKKQDSFLKKVGLSAVIGNLDIDELKEFIEKSTVENVFQMEKFVDIVRHINEQARISDQPEDDDLKAIEATMAKLGEMKDSVDREKLVRNEVDSLSARFRQSETEV